MNERNLAPSPADDPAVLLHRAAAVLHRTAFERPRGPWLWGDPELDDEQGGLAEPHDEHRPRILPIHSRPGLVDVTAPTWWEDTSGGIGSATRRLRPPVHIDPRTVTE